jgi:hypothetical protein
LTFGSARPSLREVKSLLVRRAFFTAVDAVADFINQNVNTVAFAHDGLPPCETHIKRACFFAITVWAETVNSTGEGIDKASLLESFSVRRSEGKMGLNGLVQVLAEQAKPLPRGWVEENQQRFEPRACEGSTRIGTAVLASLEKEYHQVRRLVEGYEPLIVTKTEVALITRKAVKTIDDKKCWPDPIGKSGKKNTYRYIDVIIKWPKEWDTPPSETEAAKILEVSSSGG